MHTNYRRKNKYHSYVLRHSKCWKYARRLLMKKFRAKVKQAILKEEDMSSIKIPNSWYW